LNVLQTLTFFNHVKFESMLQECWRWGALCSTFSRLPYI